MIVTDSTEMTGMEFGSYQWLILQLVVSDCYREHRNDGDGIGVNAREGLGRGGGGGDTNPK